ncbi:MAG: hypothetical protein AAB501_03495 [Patescibacteria group bacterium]
MKKVAEAEAKKGTSLFSLKRPPQVIEMYAGFENVKFGNDPIYYASHLRCWLRECGITSVKEESNKAYKGISLPRKTKKILRASVADIFGNYAFLFPEVKAEDIRSVVESLKQASRIFWDRNSEHGDEFHVMTLVENPDKYKLLRVRLLNLLDGGRSYPRKKEEVEKIAEYFVLFCESDRSVLKELAVQYFLTRVRFENYMRSTPCDD